MIREQDIQKTCLDYLRLNNIFCYKINNVGIRKNNGSFIPAGMRGIPDIIMHFKGEVVYIEVKRPDGKLSEYQEDFKKQCEKDKIQHLVIRDLDELIKFVKNGKE